MYEILKKPEKKIERKKKSLKHSIFCFSFQERFPPEPFKLFFIRENLSFSICVWCYICSASVIYVMFRYMCAHKKFFSWKVLTIRKYIKFCAVITSLYWWSFLKYLSFCVYNYCDFNIRYSNSYRRYSTDILQFLRNRPGLYQALLAKSNIGLKHWLFWNYKYRKWNFTVVSFSSNFKQRYELCFGFGDTCSMPKCSCNDWGRTGYLRKHFFAYFKE